ncbi:AAA family ATPase [Nitrosopumilus sp.]|uniref:AAA family ATPase n=1 Tax=Nitrosopumilus sp. TaxID=2024843 RepID=UPI003D0A2537
MVHINNVKCKGLYSFKDPIELDFPNNTVIVGPNNSGKSNIMRILKILTDSFYQRTQLSYSDIFPDEYNPSLEFSLQFSENETRKILDFFSFPLDKKNDSSDFVPYSNYSILLLLFNFVKIKFTWKREVEGKESDPYLELDFEKTGLKFFGRIFGDFRVSTSFPKQNESREYNNDVRLSDLIQSYDDDKKALEITKEFFNSKNLEDIGSPRIRMDPNKTLPDNGKIIITKLFSYLELSVNSSTESYFSELLGTILHKGFQISSGSKGIQSKNILEIAQKLRTSNRTPVADQDKNVVDFNSVLEEQAFSKAVEFNEILESDGSNLTSFLFSLKNSPKQDARTKFKKIQEGFSRLFENELLEFDVILQYPVSNRSRVWSRTNPVRPTIPTIMIEDKNLKRQFAVDNMGAGILESIYLLTLSYGIENSVILLDEPAVNLHPSLMKSIIKHLQTENSNQFIIITHSPELASYQIFDNNSTIVYVNKHDSSSHVSTLTGEIKEWFEKDRSKLKHQIDARIFFSKCVLLTEGESDRNLLGIVNYLETVDKKYDMLSQDIIITSVGGKKNFPKYRKLLNAFHVPHVILTDVDSKIDVFKSDKTGELSKEKLVTNGNIVTITEGNLEDFMKAVDHEKFSQACTEGGKSKPAVSMEFCKLVTQSNPNMLKSLQDFIEFCVSYPENNVSY